MNIFAFLAVTATCFWMGTPGSDCLSYAATAQVRAPGPQFTGDSIDVIVSAEAYVVWDLQTGAVIKEKNADARRPVASLSKLATVMLIRDLLPLDTVIEIPVEVKKAQRQGAHIKLVPGEHALVADLLAAAMIPSANDAAVALAVAAKGSEDEFVTYANAELPKKGFEHTRLANATGLQGGVQYSTAREVKKLFMNAYQDPAILPFLSQQKGTLVSIEGKKHEYLSTDKLLGTYLPVIAAKTGYTVEAKENLTLITQGEKGQRIGVVLLGSDSRFQDMKVLVEWIWRNYSWN
ncbi:MAG: D-alanyl-D-alanine carboxypeptidase [Candidatus Andersenbacteria bacterium]|nr:D-alanyl-D-alanine carboxypeptidase [Candidatus Andersenbacteria bacterium]